MCEESIKDINRFHIKGAHPKTFTLKHIFRTLSGVFIFRCIATFSLVRPVVLKLVQLVAKTDKQ